MIRPPSAVHSALAGLQSSLRRFDQAAGAIARFGLDESAPPVAPGGESARADAAAPLPASSEDDFLEASVNMIVAQRAFAAQLRVLEAAGEMQREAAELGGGG